MLTMVNPGSWLQVKGNFEIAGGDDQHVLDRITLERVTLADLLKKFRLDPDDPVLRLKITIEPYIES